MGEYGLTIFDIGALLFILIFSIIGIKRGFLKEFSKLFGWLFSLLGSKMLSYPLTGLVYNYLGIEDKLLSKISEIMASVDFSSIESARSTLNDGLESMIGVGPFLGGYVEDAWSITEILQSGTSSMQTELTNALMYVIEPLAHQIVEILTFSCLFILLLILTSVLLSIMTSAITSFKVCSSIDCLLGGLFGFIKGCFFVILLYGMLFVFLSITGSDSLSIFMNSKLFDILIGINDVIPS